MSELIKEDLLAAIRVTNIIRSDFVSYIVDNWFLLDKSARHNGANIRKQEPSLSETELSELGLRKNLRISRNAYEALTESAQSNPVNAYRDLLFLANNARKKRENCANLSALNSKESSKWYAQLMWYQGCAAAQRASAELGTNFDRNNIPELPRKDCDYSICACSIYLGLEV